MRLLETRWKGVNNYADEAVIDYSALPDGLIALRGPNGNGKTTALGITSLALYGTLPGYTETSRDVYDHVYGNDAYAEATFRSEDGKVYRVRRNFDADHKRSEAFVWVDDLVPEDPELGKIERKLTIVQQYVDRVFGSHRLFRAAVFHAQDNSGAITELDPPAAKRLFVEMLAHGRMARVATAAGERRLDLDRALGRLQESIERKEGQAGDVEALQAEGTRLADELEQRQAELTGLEARLEQLRQKETDARVVAERIEGLTRDVERAIQRRDEAKSEVERVEQARDSLREEHDRRIDELKARPTGAAMRERADERLQEVKDWIERRRAEHRQTLQRESEVTRARAEHPQAERDLQEAKARHDRARELRRNREELERSNAAAVTAESEARERYRERCRQLDEEAELLDDVPCTSSEEWSAQGKLDVRALADECPVLARARDARDEPRGPEHEDQASDVAAAAKRRLEVERELDAIADELDELGELPDLEPLRKRLSECEAGIRLEPEITAARTALDGLDEELGRARRQHEQSVEEAGDVDDANAAELQSMTSRYETARAAADGEVNRALERFREAKEALCAAQVAEGKAMEALGEDDDLEAIQRSLSDTRAAIDGGLERRETLTEAITLNANELGRARAVDEDLRGLREDRDRLGTERDQWAYLERAFGPNGIQALEIAGAGPEVSAIATEILRAGFGAEFAIRLVTQETLANGATRETFRIEVFDPRTRGWRPHTKFSGGERTLIGEAIHFGAAVFTARRHGIDWPVRFQDESAVHLDREHMAGYGAMLRRAIELGGFKQLVLITHDADVAAQVDGTVTIEPGRVAEEVAA